MLIEINAVPLWKNIAIGPNENVTLQNCGGYDLEYSIGESVPVVLAPAQTTDEISLGEYEVLAIRSKFPLCCYLQNMDEKRAHEAAFAAHEAAQKDGEVS